MDYRKSLSADKMRVLQATVWTAGESRHGMAAHQGYSESKANAPMAGLVEQGLLTEVRKQESSGGRRAETLQLNAGLGDLLAHMRMLMRALLVSGGLQVRQVIDVGGPGPVDFGSAQRVDPPLMPNWDGFSIRDSRRAGNLIGRKRPRFAQ